MNKKILIVEDTPALLKNLVDFFKMEGFEVIPTSHGQEALEKMSGQIPDVIITDLLMPVMDGFTFIKKLAEDPVWKAIPVVVFTAKPLQETSEEIRKFGVSKFIKKPSSVETILTAVNELVNG